MSNIYKEASTIKLRFTSPVGAIGVEDLWSLSLEQLDGMAIAADDQLSKMKRKSFIKPRQDNQAKHTELTLDILKDVIKTKLAAKKEAEERAANAIKKEKLLAALERKQDASLEEMSEEELQAELDKL